MANPLDLEPELIPFASPEERQLLSSRSLSADDEQAILSELKGARERWFSILNPTREQMLAVTHEENRMHARSGRGDDQFWKGLEADWRRKQQPTAEDVAKARNATDTPGNTSPNEPPKAESNPFDTAVAQFSISHLHEGEQNRIRARQFNSYEQSKILQGENPWPAPGSPKRVRPPTPDNSNILTTPEMVEREMDGEDQPTDTTVGQLLVDYSQRLSALSRRILLVAGQFANHRDRHRDQVTTSCLLFAAIEEGRPSPLLEDGNASEFLHEWMYQNEIRGTQYRRAFDEFYSPANPDRGEANAFLSSNSLTVFETARQLATFVRKQPVTPTKAVIHARDLVGALLFTMATSRSLGALHRLGNLDVGLEILRADYVNNFLDHELNPDDDIEKWRSVLIDLKPPEQNPLRKVPRETKPFLPSIDSDTPSVNVDLLNITPEVEGFAKIIAARDVKTPLSIGLFGDWGSGKSSFMEQLQARVEKIAKGVREKKEEEETSFLGNIVQIKFNAWHYAEANLWASLVSHVFENLSFSEAEEKEKAEKRKQLFLGKLVSTLSTQKVAEAEVKIKEANYEIAKTALDAAQRGRDSARLELRYVITQGVWPLVRRFLGQDPEAQRQITEARGLLGRTGLTEEDLKREIEASRTTVGRLQLRFTAIATDPNYALKVAGILALTILIPLGLAFAVARFGNTGILERVIASVTPIMTLIGGGFAWLRTKRKSVDSMLNTLDAAGRQIDRMYASAQAEYNIERQRLTNEVGEGQAAIDTAKQEVQAAKRERTETITALRDMEPGRVLETFVQERAASTDYRKLLGVVALIRRDFKQLSDMLREQDNIELRQAVTEILKKDEEQRALQAQAVAPDGTAGATPAAEPSEQLIDETLKDYRIDRIVLYIDDLDRCPPKQVVDVLQAIHLLLAFELFVVVVGVDARWVRHALRERYPEMLSEDWDDGNAPNSGEERLAKMATPRDYVEKIFQVPFWLKPMDDDAAQRLLEGLIPVSQLSPAVKTDDNLPADQSRADAGAAKGKVATTSGNVSGVAGQDSVGARPSLETLEGVDQATQPNQTVAASSSAGAHVEEFELVLKPDSLLLDINERNAMVALSRVIGKTPRTLKRFVNVYRIIKAGLNGQELETFVGTGPSDAQYRAVLLLLAVAYGAPDVAPTFFRELKNEEKHKGLKEFLQKVRSTTSDKSLQQNWSSLMGELRDFDSGYDVDIPLAVLRDWLPVIVRYTFQLGRLSEEVAQQKPRGAQKLEEDTPRPNLN